MDGWVDVAQSGWSCTYIEQHQLLCQFLCMSIQPSGTKVSNLYILIKVKIQVKMCSRYTEAMCAKQLCSVYIGLGSTRHLWVM